MPGFEPPGFCPKCHYPMSIGVCPECGQKVETPSLYNRKPFPKVSRYLLVCLSWSVAHYVVLFFSFLLALHDGLIQDIPKPPSSFSKLGIFLVHSLTIVDRFSWWVLGSLYQNDMIRTLVRGFNSLVYGVAITSIWYVVCAKKIKTVTTIR